MNKKWKLQRTKQCLKCPWRIDVNPRDIPGYSEDQHRLLTTTIADDGDWNTKELRCMTCHETNDAHCLGWLMNQATRGNNISLRIALMTCENVGDVELVGEQHQSFIDTLPKGN